MVYLGSNGRKDVPKHYHGEDQEYGTEGKYDLLGRMIMIGKTHNVNMKDAVAHILHPFPPSLETSEGTRTKTDKSKLRKLIENLVSKD